MKLSNLGLALPRLIAATAPHVDATVLVQLIIVFAQIGAVVFGGGMAMIPFVQAAVVDTPHNGHFWLSQKQFEAAIGLGQITPGPILISSVFVGYKVAGIIGAIVATLSVFTPSFLMTCIASGQIIRLRKNPWVNGFIKGVLPAIVGSLLVAVIGISRSSIHSLHADWWLLPLAAIVFTLLVRYKVSAVYLVVGCGVIGYLLNH